MFFLVVKVNSTYLDCDARVNNYQLSFWHGSNLITAYPYNPWCSFFLHEFKRFLSDIV